VASGRYTYRRLVEDVERELPPGRDLPARAAVSHAIDTATRPLIPLATRALMPARRWVINRVRH
jgi:hypothetical protein